MHPKHIHYLEGRGEQAEGLLLAFLQRLGSEPGLLGAYLLAAPTQPDVWLLESHWEGEVPVLDIPQGYQHWSFEVRAALGEGGQAT
ncbi:hypothetical protein EHF33_10870 [Deinococcus psychrotolerans]|uniref:Antibiotic biosynthesis monooxygenase n=1 Tax=Deinococcus psychrotolerans TaxID=2489213 RepID=A0A3G8YCX0_9DEIO|nr:hypothetical protein [Deinococcus psychrotolerans]AZI43178.1 hypothetical protein EHF33_10870 [Deinococcus psychrotolerans]